MWLCPSPIFIAPISGMIKNIFVSTCCYLWRKHTLLKALRSLRTTLSVLRSRLQAITLSDSGQLIGVSYGSAGCGNSARRRDAKRLSSDENCTVRAPPSPMRQDFFLSLFFFIFYRPHLFAAVLRVKKLAHCASRLNSPNPLPGRLQGSNVRTDPLPPPIAFACKPALLLVDDINCSGLPSSSSQSRGCESLRIEMNRVKIHDIRRHLLESHISQQETLHVWVLALLLMC